MIGHTNKQRFQLIYKYRVAKKTEIRGFRDILGLGLPTYTPWISESPEKISMRGFKKM